MKPQTIGHATIDALEMGLVPISTDIAVDTFANASDIGEDIFIVVNWETREIFFTVVPSKDLSHLDLNFEGTLFNLDYIFCPFDYFYSEIGYHKGYSPSYEVCFHNYILKKAKEAKAVFDSAITNDSEDVIRSKVNKILCPYEDFYNRMIRNQIALGII